jgi:hypothetical protein
MQKLNNFGENLVGHVKQESTLFIRSRCWAAHVATYGNGSVDVFHCGLHSYAT